MASEKKTSFWNRKIDLPKLFTGSKRASQAIIDKEKQSYSRLNGNLNRDISLSDAEKVSTVYTCISVLANTISRLPINIYKTVGNNKVLHTTHPYYYKLKYNPQTIYNYQQWMSLNVSSLFFNGNSYSVLTKKGFEILHPELITNVTESKQGALWYHSTQLDGWYKATDVLHFRLLTKPGSLIGINPLLPLNTDIQIQHKAEATVNNFLEKNANTSKILQAKGEGNVANKNIQDMVSDFTERAGMNGNEALYVVPPLYELKELSLNTEVMNFLQSNEYTTRQIAAAFGVPEHLAGAGGNGGYGKVEEQTLAFKQNIAGVLNIIRAELEFKLLSEQEKLNGVTIEFDLRPLIATDLTTHVNALKVMKDAGALSPNEMRQELGFDYVDAEPMNGFYQQMQYQNLLKPSTGSTGSNSINYLINS